MYVPKAHAAETPGREEGLMILIELMFGMALAVFLLLVLPLLLLMAGIAGAMLLWYLAPAVLLAALVFWLVFPGSHGLALLLLVLIVGLFLVERRHRRIDGHYRHEYYRHEDPYYRG